MEGGEEVREVSIVCFSFLLFLISLLDTQTHWASFLQACSTPLEEFQICFVFLNSLGFICASSSFIKY